MTVPLKQWFIGRFALLATAFFAAAPVCAADCVCLPGPGQQASWETLAGDRIRLAGILLPSDPALGTADSPWPEAARTALAAQMLGRCFAVRWSAPDRDRHGDRLVRLEHLPIGQAPSDRSDCVGTDMSDNTVASVGPGETPAAAPQQPAAEDPAIALLRRGLAVAWPHPAPPPDYARLLAAEAQAREAGQGLWAGTLRVHDATQADTVPLYRLALIEGTIRATAAVGGRLMLNFGADWRRDVTVGLRSTAVRDCPFEPGEWVGLRVRVRGWVERYNGPFMPLESCAGITVLAQKGGRPPDGNRP